MKSKIELICKQLREWIYDHGRIALFAIVLTTVVCASIYLSRFIPVELFETTITFALHLCILGVCVVGAIVLNWHIYGIKARRVWQGSLILMALIEVSMLVAEKVFCLPTIIFGVHTLEVLDLLVRDLIACLLLVYPTEVLFPKFLNVRRGLLMVIPPFIIYLLDFWLHEDMRILLICYPLFLSGVLIANIRRYRQTMEENYSSIENSALPWVKVYLVMLTISGLMYIYLCFTDHPTRLFTQQWLVLALFTYNTVQIIARRNPWKEIPEDEPEEIDSTWHEYRTVLDAWMEKEKPYLNKDFRLQDLMRVVPVNRTYLSGFVNAEYGCNFYQFVTNYRIREAQRLMQAHPDMKLQEVAEQSGFSSASVFSRTFARETGSSPTEWLEGLDNSSNN